MKPINQQAPLKCNESIAIHASPEKVWQVLTHINDWPQWQTGIARANIQGALIPGTGFTWKSGGAKIQSVLHTVEPFSFFGWEGKTMGLYAIHNWTFHEQNGLTIVTVEESMDGFLAVLFRKAFQASLEKGTLLWLRLLKQACEK
ncbi:MAG TPA: SRPBCC family protein [Sediminibacterium sp.]|nr:SRPBCC family protein [Sediminibacterium sp.]